MTHITLIGDSIFDNKVYVGKGRSVIEHLQEQKLPGWEASLRAVDGSITTDVAAQLPKVPKETTQLFLSVGGNDALREMRILDAKVRSSVETLEMLSDAASGFEARYGKMIDKVLNLNLPTTVCTIYYPRFEDALMQKLAVAALASFNDVIIRQAFRAALPLIDLRLLCNEDADYANPIEPSEAGGFKIAQTIMKVVNVHDFENDDGRTVVYF